MQPYRAYVIWKARPINTDDPTYPQNIDEFMTLHKLTKENIREFISRPSFGDDIEYEAIAWAKSKVPTLIHRAYDHAKKSGTMQDLEKFMNIIKGKEQTSQNNQFNFFGNLTDEQFRRIATREVGLPLPSSTE